jgi:hypothetical protein
VDLLNEYLALTTPDERAAFLAGLSADDLAELRGQAQASFDAIEGLSDEDLATMQSLAAVLTEVTAEDTRRTDDEATRQAEAQRIRDEVAGLAPTAEGDGDDEPELDADGNPVVPAEPEVDADGNPVVPAPEANAPVPVAASGRTPAIRAVARRAPAPRPVVAAAAEVAPLVASADVPGMGMGQAFDSNAQIADAFIRRFDAVRRGKGAAGEKVIVASANGAYGPERMLGSDPVRNTELIEAVVAAFLSGDPAAITAAGGLCAPTTVRYDQPTLGTTDRPVRDRALVRFGATRGGVRWIPAPRLINISSANPAAVSVWDVDTDENPGDTTKPCATFTCPAEVEELIEAVVRCLQFGNFLDRTFRERIDAILQLVNVWFARFADQNLLSKIDTGSIAVSSGQGLGATSDMLDALGRFVAARRSYERLPETVRWTWIAPSWVPDLVRADLARQMPHGSTDEQYALADAAFARWLNLRGIDPVWTPDLGVFGNQGIGPINGWPSTIVGYLYPTGTWAFLDGGTLDLGIVRDSTLNAQNNFQMFMETFEGAAHFGPLDSFKVTLDVCPNGTASALTTFDPCSTGS